MTTIEMTQDKGRTVTGTARGRSLIGQTLLTCGILSSLLYLGTDLLGGSVYAGYSFASQAISELSAIGASSKAVVDPLFIVYDLLVLGFGMGIIIAAAPRERALQTTAAALVGVGALGLAAAVVGPYFSMHQRGIGNLTTDAPHIILTGALVLLLLVAIGAGAFTLGKAFRVYSLATVVTVIVFGVLTIPFATRLASGQPTAGLGIVERINVYSTMLWIAVLSIALVRRRDPEPPA